MSLALGTQTGSLVNHLQSRATIGQPMPEVGMGATFLSWSDRAPGTIVEVFEKGVFLYVVVQADDYKRTDNNGMSEDQYYEFTPNPNGYKNTFRRRADDASGSWDAVRLNEKGRYVKGSSGGLRIGERDRYYDFSF